MFWSDLATFDLVCQYLHSHTLTDIKKKIKICVIPFLDFVYFGANLLSISVINFNPINESEILIDQTEEVQIGRLKIRSNLIRKSPSIHLHPTAFKVSRCQSEDYKLEQLQLQLLIRFQSCLNLRCRSLREIVTMIMISNDHDCHCNRQTI